AAVTHTGPPGPNMPRLPGRITGRPGRIPSPGDPTPRSRPLARGATSPGGEPSGPLSLERNFAMGLTSLFGLFRPTNRRPRPGRPRAGFRPRLEGLEDRRVLATLFVNPSGVHNGMSAFTTIQAAVNAAHTSGDTISVDNGTYLEQVVLSNRFTGLTL